MPDIDGNNYFTGEPVKNTFSGTLAMAINDAEEWERLWERLGHPCPGPLPEEATAHLELVAGRKNNLNVALTDAKKTDDGLSLAWDITDTPDSPPGNIGSFAILILPKNQPIRSDYKYKKGLSEAQKLAKEARVLAKAEKAERDLHETVLKKQQALKDLARQYKPKLF